jgi:hypothetical protein
MDSKIWRNLPTELIRWIIEHSDPSIDVQLAFKIPPKRLDEAKSWRLWYLLKSHDGIVYNMDTETLHVMQVPGYHVVRTPIKLSYHTAGLTIFNEEEEEHIMEYTCPCGCFCAVSRNDRCVTESRVLIKGARPSRELTIEDAQVFGDLSEVS